MDILKRFDPMWLLLLVVGGLNYAIVTLFDSNVLTSVFGTGTALDVVYVLTGIAALTYVPALMEKMSHAGDIFGAHPHRA